MPPERPSAVAQSRWRQGRPSNLPARLWAILNDEQNSSLPPYCLLYTPDRWPRTAHIRTLEALFRTPWALSCGPRLLPLLTLEPPPYRLRKQRPGEWGYLEDAGNGAVARANPRASCSVVPARMI